MPHPPRRPRWSEGLLLSPQHLGEQDRYHEERVDLLLRSLLPITWGLVDIQLDEAALSRGELAIPKLRAILPDGTPLVWGPEGGAAPPRRSLTELEQEGQRRVLVRIALPSADAPHHPSDDSQPHPRFTLGKTPPTSRSGPRPPEGVDVLDLAPVVLLNDEAADGMTVLTVAALARRADGGLEIDASFVPPALRIDAAGGLLRRLRRLLAAACERRRQLQSECRQRNGRIDYRSSEIERHLIIHALGRLIPRLRDAIEGAPSHPRTAHTLLGEIVGELASFHTEGDPAALPLYNHTDAGASFNRLIILAGRLIAHPLTDEFLTIPLTARGSGLFSAESIDAQIQGAGQVVLAIQGDGGLGSAEAFPELLKVSSGRRIDAVIRSNSRGAPARLLPEPPAAIPAQAGAVYLAVDTRDPHWQEIVYQRDLAVHLSSPIDTRGLSLRVHALPANGSDHGLTTQGRDACA